MGSTNIWHFILIVIVTQQGISGGEIRLDQSPAVIKRPQEKMKISCKISGFVMTSYYMHWIRQKPGKALEWIGRINSGHSGVTVSMKSHFTLSEDVSASTQYLEAKSLREEDTAVYYCARKATWEGGYSFDYWGKGTMVTVLSAQQSAPQYVFGLSECGSGSDGFLTVGCIAKGFSPADSLTFKWTDPKGQKVNDFVQYPTIGREGDYTKISHLRVKKSDYTPDKPYKCEAENAVAKKEAVVAPRRTSMHPVCQPLLRLTLKPPIQKDIFIFKKVILQAVISGNENKAVKDAEVSCKVENDPAEVVYSSSSEFEKIYDVTVDINKWFEGKMVTCTSDKKIVEKIHFTKGEEQPSVVIYEQRTHSKDHVSLVCEVNSPQLGDVYIMWKVDNGEYKEGYTSAPIRCKDSTSVISIFKMEVKQYEESQSFSCSVRHANLKITDTPYTKPISKNNQIDCSACSCDYQ